MATAADILPVTAWVEWAPGADPAADPTTYAWRSLTSDVMPVVDITRGRPDQFQDPPPAQMTATLLNDGRWIRLNPTGPFWGLLRRTTPFRVLARGNTNYALDNFGRTTASGWGTADTGGAWTTAGGSAADYSVGSGHGRHTHPTLVRRYTLLPTPVLRTRQKARIRINQLSTVAAQTAGLMCRYVDTDNHCRGEVEAAVSGALTVRVVKRVATVDTPLATVAVPSLTHSASAWYWLLLEASEGAPRLKLWVDGTDEPDTWLIDGSNVVGAFTETAGQHGCMTLRNAGNTNAGATFDIDGYELVDGPRARMTGNTGKLPPSWADQSMSQGYADLTVFGPLGRVQKQKALKSALFRGFSMSPAGVTTAAYWPCEDGSGSTRFASGLSGGRPIGGFTNISLGSDSSIAGSDPLPVYGPGSAWATSVPPYAANTVWSAQCVIKLPASPSATVRLLEWTTEGTIVRWAVELTPGSPDVLRLRGYNAAGTELLTDAGTSFVDGLGQELFGRQLHLFAAVQWVGSTTTWGLFTNYAGSPFGGSENFAGGSTGAGGSGNITGVSHNASAGYPSGGYTLGHIYLGAGGGITLGYGSNGYAAERTTSRFTRLCDEQRIPSFVGEYPTVAGLSKQPMGPQRTAGVADLLREVAETEAGRLVDGKLGHLTLQTRENRMRHPVNLTLDVALGQVSWPFTPADDDFGFRNSVSATSPSGARALQEDASSIAADGEYQLSLSVAPQSDDDVDQHAAWRRWLGTWDEMRFAQLVIDLRAHPELIDAWLDCDIGSRIRVLHVPADVGLPPDDLDLILEGYTETIDSVAWRVALNVVPARPWDVFVLGGSGNAGRLGTRGSSLAAAAGAGNLHTADFETGVAGWTPTGGTFAASTTHAYDGVQAGLLTTTGAPSQTIARAEVPVTAGAVYAATVRVYSAAGFSNVSAAIDWYNAGHVYLSTTNLGGSALAAGVWERRSVYGTAPVGAAFAQYGPTVGSSPAAGTAVWVDDAAFVVPLSVATSAGPVWRPGVVDFDCYIGGERVNFFYVNGSSSPQGVGAIRSRNGVSKAQASGEAVKLWRAGVLAL